MAMDQGSFLFLIGGVLLLALGAQALGHRLHVPRGTLLVMAGVMAGPMILDAPFQVSDDQLTLITTITLSMVGFLLGERLSWRDLRQGRQALIIGSIAMLVTAVSVFGVVWWLSGNLAAALVLAAISPATAPVATLDVLHEAGARGPLTRTVSQIVAVDDVWSAVLFVICLVLAEMLMGGDSGWPAMLFGLQEVFGALILGIVLGWPMAWLTGRLHRGEPTLIEAAGFVFVAAGVASWLAFSPLLTCMAMGMVVANAARHHVRPFRSIEGMADPFLFMFFFLAGFKLDWDMIMAIGWLGIAYILARAVGRILGGYVGGSLAHAPSALRRRIGPSLMPQAGIGVGLAMVAVDRLPELELILPVVVGSVIVFELIGPSLTLHHLRHDTKETRERFRDFL